jgi:hypothetical protein
LAWWCGAGALAESPEPILEAFGKKINRYRPSSSCGKFQRQWDAVQPTTNGSNRAGAGGVESELATVGTHPVDKEPDGLGETYRVEICAVRGNRERAHVIDMLACDADRFSACCQDVEVGAMVEESIDQLGYRLDDVFAVIEHEQEAFELQMLDDYSDWIFRMTTRLSEREENVLSQ